MLHVAARHGIHPRILIASRCLHDQTRALIRVCGAGQADVVRCLLELGADPSLRNRAGQTAVELAVCSLRYDVVVAFSAFGVLPSLKPVKPAAAAAVAPAAGAAGAAAGDDKADTKAASAASHTAVSDATSAPSADAGGGQTAAAAAGGAAAVTASASAAPKTEAKGVLVSVRIPRLLP